MNESSYNLSTKAEDLVEKEAGEVVTREGQKARELSPTTIKDDEIKPGSFWLVIYEHRPSVVKISPDGKGFFAPGQEELWPLAAITGWIREIKIVDRAIDELVNRFLAWPLPETVCSDPIVTAHGFKGYRSGTNLLTATEAKQMLEYILLA